MIANSREALAPDVLKELRRQRKTLTKRLDAGQTTVLIREAAFRGVCGAPCSVPIEPGDQIVCLNGAWMHLACAVCPDCDGWVDDEDRADHSVVGYGFRHSQCLRE
ncbi:hypothetical protein [Streptomyces sp. B1-3]|uniref:hypothetical protein n=1 Tax=Streptomyces sp. B1-3 TaxID=3141453 RepID=UPI003D29606F